MIGSGKKKRNLIFILVWAINFITYFYDSPIINNISIDLKNEFFEELENFDSRYYSFQEENEKTS